MRYSITAGTSTPAALALCITLLLMISCVSFCFGASLVVMIDLDFLNYIYDPYVLIFRRIVYFIHIIYNQKILLPISSILLCLTSDCHFNYSLYFTSSLIMHIVNFK